ncbi:hypothetical protein L0P49_11035 [Enterocloster bolteae]|uniref:hypothetical protein n=1 Tax=Enterocloster bolteae TaxID=208479 RepID=UPI001EDCFD57|nr:hypothetical protein [Enterocloster bolteae]MCG4900829.1 hypothetical protein [Enterocloster bolteae]
MTKVTELAIRAKAAVRYPDWRLDITGPGTAVMTNIMGRRRLMTFRQRRGRRDGPIMRAAKWIVPAVIWLLGMWMVAIVIMAVAMGVRI